MITDRIDRVTRIPELYQHPVLPAPRSVKIEISPRCNYRCGFCALRTREVQPKWDMDFALFQRITREMRDAGVEEIGVFYLGESFMNPRLLVDCIAYLKRELAMPYVFLTSNASMAFPDAVDACMAAGLDSLKWSVNAADEEQFEFRFYNPDKSIKTASTNVEYVIAKGTIDEWFYDMVEEKRKIFGETIGTNWSVTNDNGSFKELMERTVASRL